MHSDAEIAWIMNRNVIVLILLGLAFGALLALGFLYLTSAELPPPANAVNTPPMSENLSMEMTVAPAPETTQSAVMVSTIANPDQAPVNDAMAKSETELEAEVDRLTALNSKLETQLVDILNWILANFKGRYPLSETALPKLKLNPVTEEFTLHPEVAEFLNISPDEELLLNDAFTYARAVIREIEDEELRLTDQGAGKTIVHIPSYPEEGEILREELYGALEVTLGDNRFDRFLTVSEEELEKGFHHFGNASRTIIFELAEVDPYGQPIVRVKDGWVMAGDNNERIIYATETLLNDYPREYTDYIQYLPPSLQLPLETEYP
jgi:hypothetical protein